jgi:hypothetical protein
MCGWPAIDHNAPAAKAGRRASPRPNERCLKTGQPDERELDLCSQSRSTSTWTIIAATDIACPVVPGRLFASFPDATMIQLKEACL